MKGRYPNRYVFFDVPPVLAGADTIAFAPLVDHIVFVVQAGRSSLADVRKALQMLPKEKILGLVLNRQPDADATKYYYYGRPPSPEQEGRGETSPPFLFPPACTADYFPAFLRAIPTNPGNPLRLVFHAVSPDNGRRFPTGGGQDMVMVVKCESCKTEYRLNEALLTGAKGACIRCPKCRGRIIVANPQAPPVPPRIAPPAASPPSPPEVPPAALPTAVETGTPAIRGRKALRLEELFIDPSAVEGDRIPGGGEYGPMAIRSPGTGWQPPPRRPLYRRPLFLAVAISILLLAGGTFYFVDGISGRKSSDTVLPVRARSAPDNAVFDVGNLKGYLNKQASGEPLYVVKGTVTNVGKALSGGIRIEATLLGKDNQAIVRNGTFAGNAIDESLIPHMTRVRIEGFLGMRYGQGDVNRDIPVGKTLPFMVVFFDPPEGVESFRVKAIDAEEADRIGSPDGKKPGTGASNQQPIRLN